MWRTKLKPEPILFLNGEYKPLSQAHISVLDQGFLLGDGVFDVVSAWRGRIFKLAEHLDRFFDSLQAAYLTTAMTRSDWQAAIIETARRNALRDASIRFIVTRGVPQGVVADPRDYVPTTVIWLAPYVFLADETKRRDGVRLMISSTRGFAPDTLDPRYKCLDRLASQMVRLEALIAGYDDALWLDQHGHVAEAAASNVFAVKNGVLYTPALGILRGITRQVFLDLARELAIETRETNLSTFDLYTADEVFTTSTAGGCLPVREIMGRALRGAVPGPVTSALSERYWAMRDSGRDAIPFL
jgi:branched-chain amino acid aminotransferase